MSKRALLLLGVAAATGAFTSIREDELECEETVAHLENCCAHVSLGHVRCEYSTGCNETRPDFGMDESDCMQDMSCTELWARRICERAATAGPKHEDDLDGGVVTAREDLCP